MNHRRGVTLIELLIVVAIISLLIQLTLPAVEMARESARVTHCKNNLRQLALAFELHHGAQNRYPSGGWGYSWAPDPDAGSGEKQPGAWGYSLLPYYEQQSLYELGSGLPPDAKRAANKKRLETPVALHYCPSRRLPRAYKIHPYINFIQQPRGSDLLEVSARIDYAANGGGQGYVDWKEGPNSVEEADVYEFFDPKNGHGIVFPRSNITMAQITDGASKTYLVGEKYLEVARYKNGTSFGDDQGPYVCDDRDSVRVAGGEGAVPAQDHNIDWTIGFGSAHVGGFSMAYCDGSVHTIAYGIDETVHRRQANRDDGN